jgi:curli biogenesis system outer membrane secretion channel CsgG
MSGLSMAKSLRYLVAVGFLTFPVIALAQGAAPKAAAPAPRPAAQAAKAAGPVDKVIEMVKSGLSEDLVIRAIGKENLRADLGSSDMIRLKKAGVTDKVIAAMDPASATSAAAPASAPAPSSAPAVATAPAPVAPAPASAAADARRTAAVDEFDWAAVRTVSQSVFGTNVDIGKGIRAMLVKRVQEGGKMRVVERAKVNTVLKEQDFGASNRVKKGTNARIGQVRGADVYVMGDIVAFGRDDTNKRVRLGTFGIGGIASGVAVGKKEDKAVVVINYRLVDAETSEVIDTGEARGESKRESKGIGGMFGYSGGAAGGGIDMTSSNFAQTIIGEATIDAVDKIAAAMNAKIPGLPKKEVDIEARVADVSGGVVTIAAGANEGVAVGDRFEVFRIVSQIKDPVTGEVLDNKTEHLGVLVINSVRDRIASGSYTGSAVTNKDGLVRKQ